ncbi:tRNA (adenosine(37)-N6)-threonylcarbamoyltransferase complex dimerization subunit type 1 TsaB [Gemmatimonadota bacterium]
MTEISPLSCAELPFTSGPLLALETSARVGSVALATWEGHGSNPVLRVLGSRRLEEEEEHASLLLPRIGELLATVGIGPGGLGGVIVGAGPGSFTGIRVSVATAKGMARSLGIPLWAYSSLAAAVMDSPGQEGEEETGTSEEGSASPPREFPFVSAVRCVLFDARGDRVYAAAYRAQSTGLQAILKPAATTVSEICGGLIPVGTLLMGDGAARHRAVLEDSGFEVLLPPAGRPTAEGLLRLHALNPETPALSDPGPWEPDYLRASGAERMRRTRDGLGA